MPGPALFTRFDELTPFAKDLESISSPTLLEGKPVEVDTEIDVTFQLNLQQSQ